MTLPPLARLIIAPMAFSGIWQGVFGNGPSAKVNLEALFQMHANLFISALTPHGSILPAQPKSDGEAPQ